MVNATRTRGRGLCTCMQGGNALEPGSSWTDNPLGTRKPDADKQRAGHARTRGDLDKIKSSSVHGGLQDLVSLFLACQLRTLCSYPHPAEPVRTEFVSRENFFFARGEKKLLCTN